jgi:hypothetical protein
MQRRVNDFFSLSTCSMSVGPLHLLFFAESFAHHFVHRRLHKPGRDRLAVAIALSVIRDQMPVVHDVRMQCRQRLEGFFAYPPKEYISTIRPSNENECFK